MLIAWSECQRSGAIAPFRTRARRRRSAEWGYNPNCRYRPWPEWPKKVAKSQQVKRAKLPLGDRRAASDNSANQKRERALRWPREAFGEFMRLWTKSM
jgi:hypothetical protein